MKQLQEMLKQKEHELSRLQTEVEALRLVVDLCAEGHSKVSEGGGDRRFTNAAASPAPNGGTIPAIAISAPVQAANGGAKRFP